MNEQLELFKPLTRTERQKDALKEWMKHKCHGTFEFCTGFGKTYTSIMGVKALLQKFPNLNVLIVVPSETLENQWNQKIDEQGLQFVCRVGIINTIVTQQNECDLLIIDEIHKTGSDVFSKVFSKVKYKFILGLTATLERLDGRHIYIEKFCPVVDKITSIEAVANGWLAENVEYKVILDVDDIDIYNKLTTEFNEHFEFFNRDFNKAMSMLGPEGYKKRALYRDELCKLNPNFDPKETFKLVTYHATALARVLQSRKKFINTHPKKLELTREIIKYRPNSKIITFSATIDIAEKIGIGKTYSSKGGKKKNKMTIEEFNASDIAVLNTSKKADEGLDSPGLSVAIILGQDSSPTRFIQRKGRVIRKEGDKIAEIFTFVINDTVESTWFSNSHKKEESKIISIDEINLRKLLRGEEYETYRRPQKKFQFRF